MLAVYGGLVEFMTGTPSSETFSPRIRSIVAAAMPGAACASRGARSTPNS
jgi:hypothetical protein